MWPFNILFRNEKKEDPDQAEYDISRVKETLAGRIADREKSFIESALKGHSEILSIVGEAESELGKFDKSQVGSGQMDVRLHQILAGNKNTISKKLHELCKNLRTPIDSGINSIMDYYNGSYNAVSETVSTSIRNYQKIEEHLDKQIIPVFRNVNSVSGILESFKKDIGIFVSGNESLKSLESAASEFEAQASNKEGLANRKAVAGKSMGDLTEEKLTVEKQLDELVDTGDYKEFLKLTEEVSALKSRLEENRMRFLNYISLLERPMRKFLKLVVDKEIAFMDWKKLSGFLDSHEFTRESISLIREAAGKMITDIGRLELKDENRKKALGRMGEMLNGKSLDGLYEEKLKIENDLYETENLIKAKGPDRKAELEKVLGKINSDIDSTKRELNTIETDAEKIDSKMDECKQKLIGGFKENLNEDVLIRS